MDPGTMMLIGTVVSGVFSAVSAISQANAQASAHEYNAAVAERNAGIARQQAAADAERERRMGRKRIGSQKAAISASGVRMEGSALDVLNDTAMQNELEARMIEYGGDMRALGFEDQRRLETARASSARSQGYGAAAGALIGAGFSVATSGGFGGGGGASNPPRGTI